jgi:malate dehydrogenase (oxaloacetate-decarboxylating)
VIPSPFDARVAPAVSAAVADAARADGVARR